MTKSFSHDNTQYNACGQATFNGRLCIQWQQRKLMSGAWVLMRTLFLPVRSTRATIINEFSLL